MKYVTEENLNFLIEGGKWGSSTNNPLNSFFHTNKIVILDGEIKGFNNENSKPYIQIESDEDFKWFGSGSGYWDNPYVYDYEGPNQYRGKFFILNLKNDYEKPLKKDDQRIIEVLFSGSVIDDCLGVPNQGIFGIYNKYIRLNINCHLPMLKAGQYILASTAYSTGQIGNWQIINPPKVFQCSQSEYYDIENKIEDVYYCIAG